MPGELILTPKIMDPYSDAPSAQLVMDPDQATVKYAQRQQVMRDAQFQNELTRTQLEQAREKKLQQQMDVQNAGRTMTNDATAWALTPGYRGKSFAEAPAEAQQHFMDAYGDTTAAQAPQAWNEAQRAATGNPDIGAPALPPGTPIQREVNDGKVRTSYMTSTPSTPSQGGESDDPFSALSNDQKQIAKGILSYQIPPQTLQGLQRRNPQQWQQMEAALLRADPTFDANQYPARMSTMKSFAAGQDAANIASANTAIGHLNEFLKSGNDLHNSSFQPYNYFANKAQEWTGNPNQTALQQKADALAAEMAKLFKGTGAATNQEITEWRHNLSSTMSPSQLKAAAQSAMNLMSSRLDALNEKYKSAMGSSLPRPILSPKSRAILRQNGIDIPEAQGAQVAGDETPPAQLSPEDQKAAEWANANPNDPRAAQIKLLHGVK